MSDFLFRGTGTALVTPFDTNGLVDNAALERLVDRQIEGGVEALIVLGTTGENPTVSSSERDQIVDAVIARSAGRVRVVVGTGSNDTAMSVEMARRATLAGADGQLVVGPYYNKPTQDGFRAHVQAIADATDLPIILYNVPGRTGFNLAPQTTLRLAEEVPSVVGIKEASGDLAAISDILVGRPCNFGVYAGDDELALPVVLLGGEGVISVIANALPRAFSTLVRQALAGDFSEARRAHFDLLRAMRACFAETNPIPVKAVLAADGQMQNVLRLPLLPLSEGSRGQVLGAFRQWMEQERLQPA